MAPYPHSLNDVNFQRSHNPITFERCVGVRELRTKTVRQYAFRGCLKVTPVKSMTQWEVEFGNKIQLDRRHMLGGSRSDPHVKLLTPVVPEDGNTPVMFSRETPPFLLHRYRRAKPPANRLRCLTLR